jgi:serine/threonine protein kinase
MNVLVDVNGRCMIADLGLAQSSVDEEEMKGSVVLVHGRKDVVPPSPVIKGTVHFIAPEVFQSVKYSNKSDVYAMGIVLFELWSCRTPYKKRAKSAREIRRACVPPRWAPRLS